MRETVKLTKAQKDILAVCADWSASWEIADRLGREILLGIPTVLRRLRQKGYVEFGPANKTWRITSAGRKALEAQS